MLSVHQKAHITNQLNMKKAPEVLTKLLIIFVLSIIFVTFDFIFFFSSPSDSITLNVVFKIIKQYALIISIPTSILFVLIDILMEKIKTKWILYLVRFIVFFGLMYMVSLFFSLYLISSSLLENSFIV